MNVNIRAQVSDRCPWAICIVCVVGMFCDCGFSWTSSLLFYSSLRTSMRGWTGGLGYGDKGGGGRG